MSEYNSWELTDFNIDGHIALSQKYGHLKMMRSEDGTLILVGDADYGLIDQTQPTPTSFFNPDTTLGFVLDIGIQKEKQLTYRSGFYFGTRYIHPQSQKKVSQTDFDQTLFEKIGDLIQSHFQSGNSAKEIEAIKLQFLIDEYNNARLLYPNFYAESYLSLMRIIDALKGTDRGACDYATFVAQISPRINANVHAKLLAMPVYADRMQKATEIFSDWLTRATSGKTRWECADAMSAFDDPAKFVFASFLSAYQYRNNFVHNGFPFPSVVKDAIGIAEDAGTAYISSTLGQSWSRFNRPDTGLQTGDLIDIHEIVGAEAPDFQEKYFLLVPTWHFLRKMTKEAILSKINSL